MEEFVAHNAEIYRSSCQRHKVSRWFFAPFASAFFAWKFNLLLSLLLGRLCLKTGSCKLPLRLCSQILSFRREKFLLAAFALLSRVGWTVLKSLFWIGSLHSLFIASLDSALWAPKPSFLRVSWTFFCFLRLSALFPCFFTLDSLCLGHQVVSLDF